MTKGMGNITNVFAMGKGNTEGTTVSTTPDTAGNYTGNFLEKAMYRTPLNPLLCRGNLSEDFADFNVTQADDTAPQPITALAALANATAINSYEIHKADNATLNVSVTGINKSNSGTQTYSSVNRKYPNSTTVSDHLSNLETTRGNVLKTYNYDANIGQRLVTDKTTLSGVETAVDTTIAVASATGIISGDIIVVNNEEMLVTNVSSNDLTVIRGHNNTTATSHASGDKVLLKDNISNLWVLVYSDDPNTHHFAKVTEILEHDIWGDAIEFSPSLGIDIPKDTKFAIFDSNQSFSEIDADNQTLVACGYGLQSDGSNNRHYLNTHVSRPFFYFLNGEDKLEPATRYVLRSASWDGSSHTYTYSTFVTDQEYGTDIIDYGPYTMEATLVDMMYKADNPAAMNFLEYSDNSLNLEENGGSADTITVASDTSFDNLHTDLDGTEGTNWGLQGILRDSRFSIVSSGTSGNNDVYCVDSATDSTSTTLTLDIGDLTADDDVGTTSALRLRFLAHSVDLDHNKMYCAFDSTNHLKDAFRMANRPNNEATHYYGWNIGQTRYMHYTDSPLTNNIAPNAMEMIDYESVTTSGGYVDIVFADTQKILAKKIKEGDPLFIHEIIFSEEQGLNRNSEIGTFNYFLGDTTLTVDNLTEGQDIRFLLMSPIPDSKTDTGSRDDPLYDGFTVSVSGILYHIIPDSISNPSSGSQTITPRLWRKATDTEYNTSTLAAGSVPSFNTKGYRRKYSFNSDNIMTNIPIDSEIGGYSLDYDGSSAAPTKRNLTTFETLVETDGTTINVGSNVIEKQEHSRINNINLILRGGSATGHRLHVEYGDKINKFIKLKTHLKDERFLESYNKTDFLPYSYGMSNVSLYGYPINTESVPVSGSQKRYDLSQNGLTTNNHVRGTLSYLDYFKGVYDIEKKVFSGVVESVEQVVEDGMFKLKIRGRNDVGKLLGPIVNKDFKFTEDIVYSTIGPIERMAAYGIIENSTIRGIYEVGATEIIVNAWTARLSNGVKGDLLFTAQGIFIGRIYNITGSDPYTITLEEGIPTRIKDREPIYISSQLSLTDIVPDNIPDDNVHESGVLQYIRGNTVSFAKALSSNPFSTTRVNSLLGASDKGIIFNGGKSLGLSSDNAPFSNGPTLVGTSSSSHPLAKGYSIHAIDGIDYDFPFYCHLADEITDKYTVDYVNLHTVNSLTDYDIININSKDNETIIEVAPICPAVLARVDNNPLDNRDKTLVSMGNFPANELQGYSGIFEFSTWIEELNEGDYIFDSDGNLFGRIIDISIGSSDGLANDRVAFTLDRPLFKRVTTSDALYKYYSAASPPQYIATNDIEFDSNNSADYLGGAGTDRDYRVSYIHSSDATARLFLDKLEEGMRIKIEGHADKDNNGVFTISQVLHDATAKHVIFYSRKQMSGHRNADGFDAFNDDGEGDNVRITVLTDYFTQGLYFLNTQGLGQGGVVTLVNNSLSSPSSADKMCKPIKWCGGLYHYITDLSVASGKTTDASSGAAYNPNASAHTIFSDMIDRYGNTKWRYFGLQKGKYLSYISRRRKDGKVKDSYTTEKGKVSGYATAYRISDAKFGSNKVMKYPYGYHNNDFAWSVRMYDDNGNAYVELFESENKIKSHPYFLEYLSPESRDFRPVMGSNFADFSKHGTTVTSPEHSDYRLLQYPRFMPRLHDNFRGGDWQEDTESLLNSDLPSTLLQYRRWKTDSTNAADYDIDYAGGDNAAYIDPAGADSTIFTQSLVNQWVKLSGWPDRNNNRTFKLGALSDIGGHNKFTLDISKPPFSQIGTQGSVSDSVAVGGSQDDSTGHEEISVLYPPWIGPKFDGITRAKDHWELPDPKTLRWFIFSPSDMYPDSMSRKHHIGYSGDLEDQTIDYHNVTRSFTDYSLLLKGESSFSSSNVSHEHYEGSLEEEQEIDDQYESLPISEASIIPSQMKRFGLMRLVDCTYDWHFNLIDPERLPSDMSKLNTPNFEYTRYQPLKRLNLLISDYTNSDTRLTVSANPSSLVASGDQVFTDKGFYLGKVKTRITGGTHAIELQQAARKPILQSSGTAGEYHGYVYVCGDGVTTISTQDFSDSFYRFQVKGRGGQDSFTEVSFSKPLNMLQQMWNGNYSEYLQTASAIDKEIITTTTLFEFYQIPYGVIDDTTNTLSNSMGANGWGIADTDFIANNKFAVNADSDVGITSSLFLRHFNKNFLEFGLNNVFEAYSRLGGFNVTNPLITLPPSFKSFYSTSVSPQSTGKTINAMQEKKFLLSKTQTPIASGVLVDGAISADDTTQITVKTVDATTKFSKGDVLYDDAGAVVGLIYEVVSATRIDLYENNVTALGDGENLHLVSGNEIQTEYTHPSNILEWNQLGGNPYVGCNVISLGRYNIENSVGVQAPVGGRTRVFPSWTREMMKNFPHSKPARTSAPSGDSEAESLIPYGDGFGKFTSSYGNADSSEYTFLGVKGYAYSGFAGIYADADSTSTGYIGDGSGYVADGVFGVFHPILHMGTNRKLTLTGVDESRQGTFAFDSVNGNTKEGVLRLTSGPTDLEDTNSWLNFVDLTGMYLVGNIGTKVGEKTTRLNYAPLNADYYDLPTWDGETRSSARMVVNPDLFFMTVTTTSGSAVVNYGPSASGSFANPKLEAGDVLTIYGGNGTNLRTISSVDTSSNQKNFTMSGTASASGTIEIGVRRSSPTTNSTGQGGFTSMADTMVDPNHIIYVKEHRRNITGKTVAHEIYIDNVPHNMSGNIQFFDTYRVMRPAETCIWRRSPEEIDMYKLSAQTTKMPQEDKMYDFVPSLYRTHKDNSFAGPDIAADNRFTQGDLGENEAVMSMYVAIDMDARKSQFKSLGNVSAVNGSNEITASFTLGVVKAGDTMKIGNQMCYVEDVKNTSVLYITDRYIGSTASVAAKLFNNTYTVLRDYIYLFNPTGNRNTFKSGSSYNMLLTDGLSKQKISMGVDADYYDKSAICRLSIGKMENDMLGIVSFGETFTLKSNKPTNSEIYTSAKIGSTVLIGQEVEDVINNLLSSEDIQYDIQDNREYPYYITPNYQGVDIFNAANFAAKYKEKEIRLDEIGISLIKQTNVRDYRPIVLSYDNTNLNIISVTRNKSTFDLYNEIIVYGNGVKTIKRNRKSIEKFGKKTLEDINMELISQDDVDSRAKILLKAHSEGDDRFTVKMSKNGIELIRAGDIITLDFPAEGIESGQYKIYEIRRELMGLVELEVGTYRKDLANRFAELSMLNKSNAASIRGSQFKSTTAPLDFFDTIKLKELRLVIKKISLADPSAFTLGFQTLTERKLDFGTTMAPLDTVTTIITDEDLI